MERLILKIKEKRELSDIPDSFIKEIINQYLVSRRINLPMDERNLKIIVKDIREILRRNSGMFQNKFSDKKRKKLLAMNRIEDLLKTHRSTKERSEDYILLKKLIKEMNVNSILDLGCGINPLALSSKKIKYYAYDIKKNELELIKDFFKIKGHEGLVFCKDIRGIRNFPKTDLVLILKVLDILDKDKFKTSEKLLNKIEAKYILVSFSTFTLSGKKMKHPRRIWFEQMLKKNNYNFEIIKGINEIFYLIK